MLVIMGHNGRFNNGPEEIIGEGCVSHVVRLYMSSVVLKLLFVQGRITQWELALI